jgi:transketolase
MRMHTDLRDPASFDHIGRDKGIGFVAGRVLADLADDDPRIVAATADLTYTTQMEPFAQRHPDRFVQFGIAERNMMTAAAGIATTGFIPYVSTFAAFAGLMGYENLRTDMAYPHLPVRVLATHSGISMGYFATSHHATEDISSTRSVAGLTVVSPSDSTSTEALLRSTVDLPGPIYFRLGRGRERGVYPRLPEDFVLGRPQVVSRGSDVLLVSTGAMVERCVEAATRLRETDVSVTVLDVHTLKPFDTELVAREAGGHSAVVVVEEHNVQGGLGTLVVEAVAAGGVGVPVYKHGLYDEFGIIGRPTELYSYYGLDGTGIQTVTARALDRIGRGEFFSLARTPLWTSDDKGLVLERAARRLAAESSREVEVS